MNIVLIGMRGSGKSAIGKKIAEILLYKFFDLDVELTASLNKSIAEIVEEGGWEKFREEELKICEKISRNDNAVISTGGGIILDKKNIENLKKNGIIVFLNCDLKILKERRKNQIKERESRPLLAGINITGEIEQVWEERKDKYFNSADIVFDVSEETLDKTTDLERKSSRIIALVKEKVEL